MSEVRVSLKVDEGDPERYFHVQVLSRKRKGLLSGYKVPEKASRVEYTIAAAGGAVAEEQNERYGDNHDPDQCAQLAVEAYKDVLKKVGYGEAVKQAVAAS